MQPIVAHMFGIVKSARREFAMELRGAEHTIRNESGVQGQDPSRGARGVLWCFNTVFYPFSAQARSMEMKSNKISVHSQCNAAANDCCAACVPSLAMAAAK